MSAIDRMFLPIGVVLVTLPIIATVFDQALHWLVWLLLWAGGVL